MPISECYDFPDGGVPMPEIISNIEDINITENGVYSAPRGTAYKNIDVNVKQKISDEYIRKLIESRLDEPLIIPPGTKVIRKYAFYYLNNRGSSSDIVCPLVELPEGNKISIEQAAFQYARIKKIIVPSDNTGNSTYIFANNKDLEEVIWKTNTYSGNMCRDCTGLKRFIFEGNNPYMSDRQFYGCKSLELVDLSKCIVVPVLQNTNCFENVPTTCEFRIPAALYDKWIKATNWSTMYAKGYKFIAV